MVNQKTTAVRVIPVEGKGVGEMANFGGLMGYAPIIPVNQTSCEAFGDRDERAGKSADVQKLAPPFPPPDACLSRAIHSCDLCLRWVHKLL